MPPLIMKKYHRWTIRRFYSKQFLQYMRMNGIIDIPVEGEADYIKNLGSV